MTSKYDTESAWNRGSPYSPPTEDDCGSELSEGEKGEALRVAIIEHK